MFNHLFDNFSNPNMKCGDKKIPNKREGKAYSSDLTMSITK